jgi:hypothetical protein
MSDGNKDHLDARSANEPPENGHLVNLKEQTDREVIFPALEKTATAKPGKSSEMRGFQLEVPLGQSMRISDWDVTPPGLTNEEREFLNQVTESMSAYFKQIELLLNGPYSHLKEVVPSYLSEVGVVLVACCSDGVVVRFDRKAEKCEKIVAWFPDRISGAVKALSNGLIDLHGEGEDQVSEDGTGIEMRIFSHDPNTGTSTTIATMKIRFDAVLKRPEILPSPPQKPFCLISVKSAFELSLFGRLIKTGEPVEYGRSLVSVANLQLPVGWECIEVYPGNERSAWKSEYAEVWAERDLLAAATSYQFREQTLKTLDPNAEARRQFEGVFVAFKSLLDSDPETEESLQKFLKDNPSLLCPSHIRVWPKLRLGAHQTDFVFHEASGDYLLVELERSTLRPFRRDGHPTAELNHALGQITDWKRYLEDNLATVQRELKLTDISTNPRRLVVIGRSQMLDSDNRRKLRTLENERPKTKILTYDDVLEMAGAVVENLLGPLFFNSGSTRVFFPNQ